MSRSDGWSIAVTLTITGIVWFVGGRIAAIVCIIIGLAIALILHFTFPNGEEPSAVPLITSNQDNSTQTPNASPRVRFVQSRRVLLQEDFRGVCHELGENLQAPQNAIVAQFMNDAGKEGQRVVKARDVSARLVFECPENPEKLVISHGDWVGHYANNVSFRPGEAHQLLVALKLTPFVTYENPNLSDPSGGRIRAETPFRRPQQWALPGTKGVVEIKLVDGECVTVFHGFFDYAVSVDDMFLTLRPKHDPD